MPKAGITYGPRITAPDYEQIGRDAERQVLDALGLGSLDTERPQDLVAKARPDNLVAKAAEVLQQADAELAAYLGDRNQALAHLWFYDPRLGLARTAGLSTMGYRGAIAQTVYGDKKHALPEVASNEVLAKLGAELGVKRIKDVETKLVEAAKIVYAARIRRDIAVRYMQEAGLVLSEEPYGWSPDRIAEHAGVHRDLIYKQRRTARQRQAK
jgi:hypothetical protein